MAVALLEPGQKLLKNKPAARVAYQKKIERYPGHAWTPKAREKAHE